MIDRAAAEIAIKSLFAQYKHQLSTTDEETLKKVSDGKLYELYVLSVLTKELKKRGATLKFHGGNIKFKGAPGKIKASDPHFTVKLPNGKNLWLFVDIEFRTLGSAFTGATDNSNMHELDIVLVEVDDGYPTHEEIWLAVECKAVANFEKWILKEALGVRRELSLKQEVQKSRLSECGLSPEVEFTANPASEFWLAFIDPNGLSYSESPKAFGIEFRHIQP